MAGQKTPSALGTESIGKLLMQYAVPAIIAMTASSLYGRQYLHRSRRWDDGYFGIGVDFPVDESGCGVRLAGGCGSLYTDFRQAGAEGL